MNLRVFFIGTLLLIPAFVLHAETNDVRDGGETIQTECPPTESCTWNSECFGNEHCLEGCCVPSDSFNECWSDFDCWPGQCDNGLCVD